MDTDNRDAPRVPLDAPPDPRLAARIPVWTGERAAAVPVATFQSAV